ncbi:hypothetical protein CEW81_11005 [Kluyvera genomosp. 3]|uniref:Pyridine nucleotide-disulphide oxidoreductase N-terminal domain-containing protein n=1 Tax=Kluyvera genomosp. 3 TaxID=2774055 RepID=A0A248KI97_9ENTR|nr:hypothetical protein CEW81_11005 [Kluyvera genomosp. 3]
MLGVEAAAALRRNGDNVTLVHRSDRLMEQQLDAQAAALLTQRLKERGIACALNAGITQITRRRWCLTTAAASRPAGS